MVYAKKEDDYYWMPFMKTLPESFVERYKEVCKILAGKSLKEVEEEEEGDAVNDPTKNVFIECESTTTSSHCYGRKPPPEQCKLTSLTCLSREEISILQCAANETTDMTHQCYCIGLSLGLNYLLLNNNLHRPRLEMFLAARINNYIHLTPKQFITDIINKKVQTNVSGMFQYVDFIKDFDGTMDMSHWCIAELERE